VLTTPFGALVSQTGSGAITSDAGFPGQRTLMEIGTNVSYNWHRHYDASLGRYLQPDPLGLIDGTNRFAYAGSNPVMWSDPRGERISAGPMTPIPPGPNGPQRCLGGGDPDCELARAECHEICIEPKISNPWRYRDTFGTYRMCMRFCMESKGCFNY
jgi:RHS repeat-associated protein